MRIPRLSRLALVAFIVLGAATAVAQQLLADFSGGWNVQVDGPQGPMSTTLTLTQTADSVTGKFESEVGSGQVRGSVKGDSLRVVFALDVGGQAVDVEGNGALKDPEHMDGKFVVSGMGEFPFTATRQPK